jgi:hypothetical protein
MRVILTPVQITRMSVKITCMIVEIPELSAKITQSRVFFGNITLILVGSC